LCERFEEAYARATANVGPEQSVLYLIWRDPWMTVAPDTYIAQTLALFGWRTVPAAAAERYPQVDPTTVHVDRVLLSSEPFHFKEHHVAEVEALVPDAEVSLIDGEMTSWYGSRAIAGLDYLAEYTR
jgi:ABC-type Fe3+-hydroxamate transport system substrate-binding protein